MELNTITPTTNLTKESGCGRVKRWTGPNSPDPVLPRTRIIKTIPGNFLDSLVTIWFDQSGRLTGHLQQMTEKTNVCGDRIAYNLPADVAAPDQERYERAVDEVEDILAIIAEIQEDRKNDAGEIGEPLSSAQINTIIELTGFDLHETLSHLKQGSPK